MDLPDRHMLIGMPLGALCGVVLGTFGPGMVVDVLADEMAGPAFDPAQLVRFEDRDYRVESEDWISSDPLSTVRVKKIEAGKVSYVTITTTATGTYSTDAMFARHVQYPGISVAEVSEYPANDFRFWSDGRWYAYAVKLGDSFRYFGSNWH